jgi:hypothetical protein
VVLKLFEKFPVALEAENRLKKTPMTIKMWRLEHIQLEREVRKEWIFT